MTRQRSTFASDLLASVVVFLVALPLCMGIAIASGVPPALGLITGMIGGLVAGALAGCSLQASGPAAGLAVFIFQLVQEYGIAALGPLVIAAGLLQLTSGLLKAGQLFRAISPAVIHGMLAGIGVLIFGAQFHVMVDDQPRASGIRNLLSIPESIYKGVFPIDGSSHHLAAFIGLCTIVVLVVWSNWAPRALRTVPGALVAVVTATAIASIAGLPIRYVDVPDNLFATIQWVRPESMRQLLNGDFLIAAVALAFVASAETLLSAAAVDQMHGGKRTDYDRELIAQGTGNLLCGVFGALPMTGVIVRSATNVNAGAKTRLSSMLHGLWLVVLVLAFPQVLRMVPTASLAAVLVYTGYKLVSPATIRRLRVFGWPVLAVYAATVIFIVATDMLTGILVGLGLSIVKLIYAQTHLAIEVANSRSGDRVDVYLKGAATFVRLPKLADALEAIPQGIEVHIHVRELSYTDHAAIELLTQWERQRTAKGGVVRVEWQELMEMYHQRNSFLQSSTA
ncbi:MAG: hypothetical protein IANPNBLG_02118 [Bryobacteraceae bacterium]|nr:hypothetical protein [Bryobacteraceae bacterium]